MAALDWFIVGAMIVSSLVVGLWFAKRANTGAEGYFVAGRSLGWFLAGTSMVATTFSSDTPLFVSGMVRQEGIYANWVWWSAAPAALATTFFFAKLWRRSEAVTELEFIAQRYPQSWGVHTLRILRALADGGFQNAVIMASVTLAASKILVTVLGLSAEPAIVLPIIGPVTPALLVLVTLGIVAITYTAISGLYGVIYTDVLQFAFAMVGAVILAIIVWVDLARDPGGALAKIEAASGANPYTLALVPDLTRPDLPTLTFFILICVSWIGSAPGGGHFVQRMLAARTERDAMLSMYWYAFANYVLRSWPWIAVGLASLVYLPTLQDHESAYPHMISMFLPAGLKGVMVASLMAAFMSTLTSQMNWGTSYLINDVYRPYLAPSREPHHYVVAGRVAMLLLTSVALVVSSNLGSILGAYKYLAVMSAGNAFVLIARWYWWRVNVWTEISSLISSLAIGAILFRILPDGPGQDYFAIRIAVNLGVTTLVAIGVTLATSDSAPSTASIDFHRRLRIGGAGWKRVEQCSGIPSDKSDWANSVVSWLSSIAFIYALLVGMGQLLLQRWSGFAVSCCIAVAAGYLIHRRMPAILAEIRSVRQHAD